MQLIGRKEAQAELQHYLESSKSEFVVVYGRRRVGKTYLVRQYFNGQFAFYATGIARANMAQQLKGFNATLKRYGGAGNAKDWFDAFEQVRELLESGRAVRDQVGGKLVVFIDEMPWLDTPRSSFMAALEFFWNSWASARDDVMLVACGSATSWITKKLFQNRGGLHNRVTGRIHLAPFTLRECNKLLRANGLDLSKEEVVEAYMTFGGIPYYLELLDRRQSLVQNIDRLCFAQSGQLRKEFDELFHSLFSHSERHIEVVRALSRREAGMQREDIIAATSLSNGGGLTSTLDELCQCGFVRCYKGFGKASYGETFQLVDPFTLFWLRFVEKEDDEHWWSTNKESAAVRAWSGKAFELVCLLHLDQIVRALGIWGVSTNACSWKSRTSDPGAQIDLVIDRADNVVNLCEMKWVRSGAEYAITKSYDHELRNKIEVFARETRTKKALHLTLVCPGGVKRNTYWSTATSVITADDLFA